MKIIEFISEDIQRLEKRLTEQTFKLEVMSFCTDKYTEDEIEQQIAYCEALANTIGYLESEGE